MTSKPKKSAKTASEVGIDGLPPKAAIVEAMQDHPDLASKRDLTRYFNIKGAQRPAFKQMLRELEREGHISRQRKTLTRTGDLPSVTILTIDKDSSSDLLIAYPVKWNEKDGPAPKVLVKSGRAEKVHPGPGERILARITRTPGDEFPFEAKTIKILGQSGRAQIGIVRMDNDGARLVPVDRKQKEMRIKTADLVNANDGDLVEVEVKPSGRLMVPMARVTNIIGNPKSEGAVSLIALHNLEIPHRFPKRVEEEAEKATPVGLESREDWRHLPFVTIDPATAKDHDDAVFAQVDDDPKNAGGFEIFVSIADVATYVRPASEMDIEAKERGNSVYFPDRVVPMLPEKISNDLCSLREKENRPALAVKIIIDDEGKKKSHSFHRVLIRSAAKLSYQQAQKAFDGQPDHTTAPLQETVLEPLYAAYGALAKQRDKRNPLALDLPERRIELNDKGFVRRIFVPDRLEAHRLIEEMMILANVCAAETLEQKSQTFPYRVHDAPGREKLNALDEFLQTLDLRLAQSAGIKTINFNQILRKVNATAHDQQVSEMVLRTQARAEYTTENIGHFGLNLDRYAHFTSPIRRYADLLVHRALIYALNLGKDGIGGGEIARMQATCEHISFTERRAMAAERETQDRLIANYLADKLGAQFEGNISGVTSSGLFVRLNETGADGFVPASTLGKDYFAYVEAAQALIGERYGEMFQIGDEVEVRLLEAQPEAGAMRFEILNKGKKAPPKVARMTGGGKRRGHHRFRDGKAGGGRGGRTGTKGKRKR